MAEGNNHLPPIDEAHKVPVELLDFDQNNPRFTPDKEPSSDSDSAVVAMLATSADLAELVQSISTTAISTLNRSSSLSAAGVWPS